MAYNVLKSQAVSLEDGIKTAHFTLMKDEVKHQNTDSFCIKRVTAHFLTKRRLFEDFTEM